jgi:hypothetical protein
VAALALAGGGSIAAASVASAATPGCDGSVPQYCGSQLLDQPGSGSLALDVYQQQATYNNKIIVWQYNTADPAQDFIAYPDSNGKYFEYAPNGKGSGLCLSLPETYASDSNLAVLRICNGSLWQSFTFQPGPTYSTDSYGQWVNGYGMALTDTHRGGQGQQQQGWTPLGQTNQFYKVQG